VGPALPHLTEQLLLELGTGRLLRPAQPCDQQRLARIGQNGSPGKVAK